MLKQIQWNLRIKDTLGQPLLSFVRRLSSLGGSKYIGNIERKYSETSSHVLCREAAPYFRASTIRDFAVLHIKDEPMVHVLIEIKKKKLEKFIQQN